MRGQLRRLDAREAERLLASFDVDARSWAPGPTHVLAGERDPKALVRVGEPEPGEGYHREHVRLLQGSGSESDLSELLARVVAAGDERLRLESDWPTGQAPAWEAACEAAGLTREVTLPGAWCPAPNGEAGALECWGRPGKRRREAGPPAAPVQARPQSDGELELVAHSLATRSALEDFLLRLVPGRSYPPGVLLSDAERVETRRPGDLDADWMLALAEDGSVGAAAVLEPDGRPERAHVRRVHVDVLPEFRGRGVATSVLRAAVALAAALGVERVEADPRGGHQQVIAALMAAGLTACGRRPRAWRMRTATASWDEDLLLLSTPTA